MRPDAADSIATLPPIVLLVDEHRDALDRVSRYLEDAGLWVAATTSAAEAVAAAEDLRPDIVVADDDAGAPEASGGDIVDAFRRHPHLSDVPLIVMASAPRDDAGAVIMVKPIDPSTLLSRAQQLLGESRAVRARARAVVQRGEALRQRSSHLIAAVSRAAEALDAGRRPCPKCGERLEWVEQHTVGGAVYDYYRWCLKGCGLYCFDRSHDKWVKLT